MRRIPRGRVASYGVVARRAGLAGHARQVGYALHALPRGSTLPWHRVVNAAGRISLRRSGDGALRQRLLLEQEGVHFGAGGRIPMGKYAWGAVGNQ